MPGTHGNVCRGCRSRRGRATWTPKHRAFREELAHVNAPEHPNRAYFIFKSIIVNNLFGVDIMEEATEICKLRLFLKLVAQVEPDMSKANMGVEPLPDVDFNVRAGNTLVGYVNKEDMDRLWAATGQLPYDRDPELKQKVREYSLLLADFRKQQLGLPTPKSVTKEQVERAARIIREGEYSNRPGNAKTNPSLNNDLWNLYKTSGKLAMNVPQDKFNDTHTPLHWFVEFPEVMAAGGFDVIIGNPPYVEYSKVRNDYTILGFQSLDSGNLYAYVIEKCLKVQKIGGRIGMIIQLSAFCTPRMISFQDVWFAQVQTSHLSFFDDRPGKLFDGLEHIRVAITIGQRGSKSDFVATTQYTKFATEARPTLFDSLHLQHNLYPRHGSSVLKVSAKEENSIIRKMWGVGATLSNYLQEGENDNFVYYGYGYGYWGKILNYKSYFKGEKVSVSTGDKYIYGKPDVDRDVIAAVMNSSLFYWF